jgi:hypothetical protein
MGALHVHGTVVTCYSCAHEVIDCGAWGIVLEGCGSCSWVICPKKNLKSTKYKSTL